MKRRKKGKPVFSFQDATDLFDDIVLPPNFRVDLFSDASYTAIGGKTISGSCMRVEHLVTTKGTTEQNYIGTTYKLDASSPEQFLANLRTAMCNLAAHEIDEFFTYNGKFINDPHPDS